MTVIKRDGKKVDFDVKKIERVINLANKSVPPEKRIDAETVTEIANKVVQKIGKRDEVEVEEIQDIVEQNLLQNKKAYLIGKEFLRVRDERAKERFKRLGITRRIKEKLDASNVQNQNANLDEHSFGGRKGEADGELLKQMALDYYISPKFAKNHLENRIYIHDLDNYVVGMHNCAIRSEKFITSEGVKSFEDFNDGEEVIVLNKDGNFVPATVRCFGRQPMQEITLKKGKREVVKVFTKDHRWLLKDGTVTTKLSIGDVLASLPEKTITEKDIKTKRDAEMFALGFVIGDGCDYKNYYNVRLCGKKIQYKYIFEKAGYSVRQKIGEDEVFIKKYLVSKQSFLTDKLWKMLGLRDKQMLFAGYYAADGNKNSFDISTSDERCVELIEDISALSGYHVYKINQRTRDTQYKKDANLWTVTFNTYSGDWVVKDIRKGNHRNPDYEAWCIVEPETHTFVLSGGIITGNCLSIPFDYLLKYGFNTRQTDIRPASSVNTAFQLVAVIFQLQSLQQFGGVSATHLDWTMVPYVRISFWKHFKELLNAYNTFNEGENFDPIEMPVAREDAMNISIDSKLYKFDKKIYDMALVATEKETLQAVEGMYHNLNTLQSRSGNQLPFTSINYGTCTLPEGRMVIKALLEASLDGVGKLHKTPIFPCGIFQKKKGINDKGSKNHDLYKLAIKSTSKRLYPNYANGDWSGNDDTKSYELKEKFIAGLTDEQKSKLIDSIKANKLVDVLGLTEDLGPVKDSPLAIFSTMGCRTANSFDINWYDSWVEEVNNVIAGNLPTSNFLATGQQKDGRGNICPATIILPTLAMEAKRKAKDNPEYIVDYFMDILEKAIGDCKDELIERFNWICAQSPASAKFMYENGTMYGYKESEGIRSALKHGTLAIGQLGLAETLQILIGCDQTEEKGMALAKQIEQLFKDKCAEFKEEWRFVEPSKDMIINRMIKNIQEKECRELSEGEINDIRLYVLGKYAR